MLLKFRHISCLIVLTFLVWVAIPGKQKNPSKFWRTSRRLVLTGEISKALGTYDEHLQGSVEYLLCGTGRQRVRKYYRPQ